MNNIIIPETILDVITLKETLSKQLPAGYKYKTPLLNRKCLRVIKSFGIVTEVIVQRNKIIVQNAMPLYTALATLFCLPYGIYLISKMKDGAALRATVHDIVTSATRKH